MADNESGTESGTEGTEQQQQETQQQQESSSSSSGDSAVKASVDALNTTVKGLSEMVAKLPETLANLVKVSDKEAPPQTEGKPGGSPPQEKQESQEPKYEQRPHGAQNRFGRWWHSGK